MEIEAVTFEDAFGRLEQTVAALDRGDLTLERALVLFEDGMQLVRSCNSMLDQAELRLQQLVPACDGYALVDMPA